MYVRQTRNDKSPLLIATLLCLSLGQLLRGIFYERPTAVSEHGNAPLSEIHKRLLYM